MPTISEIQNSINNSTSSCSWFCLLQTTAEIKANVVHRQNFVATVNDLPSLCTFAADSGMIVFVDELRTPVYHANNSWITLDGCCVVRRDFIPQEIWTWGSNECGQLGIGTVGGAARGCPLQEACNDGFWSTVASGDRHVIALKRNGTLWGWGDNSNGQHGTGTTTVSCLPVQERCLATNWCRISAGSSTTAAIKTDGTLWAWGNSTILGMYTSSCSPIQERSSSSDWSTFCAQSGGVGLKTNGTIWGWGFNNTGRLGTGNTTNSCSPVQEICSATNWCRVSIRYNSTGAIKTDGTLWTWGYNGTAQLGTGNFTSSCSPIQEFCSATNWCQVSMGTCHSAAIKTNGTLWSWGSQYEGRLANNINTNNTFSCSPVQEICSATNWCLAVAGDRNGQGLKTDGTLWSWGRNFNCQIGDGSFSFSGCPLPKQEFFKRTCWCTTDIGAYFCSSAAAMTVSSS